MPAMSSTGATAAWASSNATATSSAVREPIPNLALSNIVRSSVAAMAKTLANELAGDNIRVNHLLPGRIDTDRVKQLDAIRSQATGSNVDEVRAAYAKAIPLGRYGAPEEYASAAVFLFSDAARYITGASLQVDGGSMKSA